MGTLDTKRPSAVRPLGNGSQDGIEQVHNDPAPVYDTSKLEPELNVGGQGATQRRLRDYQVTMIGFCSGIGTGLFVGTGAAYAKAGPAGLLLAYSVVGAVLWCVMQSISELATVVCIKYDCF